MSASELSETAGSGFGHEKLSDVYSQQVEGSCQGTQPQQSRSPPWDPSSHAPPPWLIPTSLGALHAPCLSLLFPRSATSCLAPTLLASPPPSQVCTGHQGHAVPRTRCMLAMAEPSPLGQGASRALVPGLAPSQDPLLCPGCHCSRQGPPRRAPSPTLSPHPAH